MPSPYVYQYLWRDFSLPARQGWVLTLSDNEALAFLGAITIVIAYVQGRTWNALRDIFNFIHSKKHVQLQNPRVDEKRASLSQVEALERLWIALRQCEDDPADTIQAISPWLGAIAVLNILAFVILGIVIPWTLTGGLETPVVRPGKTDSCIGYEDRKEVFSNNAHHADSLFKQCWNNLSVDANPCGRMDGIFNDRPPLGVLRGVPCPFPLDVCHEDAQPVQLEHKDMSLRHFGVNSKSKVLMSHRLTCSPLKTEHFLLFSDDRNNSLLAFHDSKHPGFEKFAVEYTALIFSRNGSNQYSNQSSGRIAALANRPYQLEIFPDSNISESRNRIHPALRRQDGNVFVLGYRAGRSYYDYPIDAPSLRLMILLYYGQFCTPWGSQMDNMAPLLKVLPYIGDLNSFYVLILFHHSLINVVTVQFYLFARRGTQSLLSSQYRFGELINYVDAKEQWVKEVTAWFETAFLQARYREFHLLQGDRPLQQLPEVLLPFEKKFGEICNRILFFDGNYTNIDFIQLMIIVSCLMAPWLISFRHPIAAGASRIAKPSWCIAKRIGVKVRAAAIYGTSLVKTAYRRAQPASRRRFPYSAFWSRPENRRLHFELDSIGIAVGNTVGPERPSSGLDYHVPQVPAPG